MTQPLSSRPLDPQPGSYPANRFTSCKRFLTKRPFNYILYDLCTILLGNLTPSDFAGSELRGTLFFLLGYLVVRFCLFSSDQTKDDGLSPISSPKT